MNRLAAFTVTMERHAELLHLRLIGELDIGNLSELKGSLPSPAPGETLIMDLRELEFIDSSGIHVLMQLDNAARREDWSLALVRAPALVQRVLDICRFADRVRTVDTPAEILPGLS